MEHGSMAHPQVLADALVLWAGGPFGLGTIPAFSLAREAQGWNGRHAQGGIVPDHEIIKLNDTPSSMIPLQRSILQEPEASLQVLRELWEQPQALKQRYVRLLEQRTGHFFQSERRCLAVGSVPWGLLMGMQALDLAPGDRVIVPALANEALLEAMRFGGFQPVFADIDPDNLGLDAADAALRLDPRVRAIALVHVHGVPCPMGGLQALARRGGLKLIVDASAALGGRWQGESLSETGDAVVFAFEGPHSDSGGALLVLADDAAAGHAEQLRQRHRGLGAQLPELQAALAWMALPGVDAALAYRCALVALYRQRLGPLALQSSSEGAASAWQSLAVRLEGAAGLERRLAQHGVQAEALTAPDLGAAWEGLPNARQALRQWLRLPLHNGMTRAQVDRVAEALALVRP
jgi:dTDP-4-amino-4,6-dideoxygalactose transaminase